MNSNKARTEFSLLLIFMLIITSALSQNVHAAKVKTASADNISCQTAVPEYISDTDTYTDTNESGTNNQDFSNPAENESDINDNGTDETSVCYDVPVLNTSTLNLIAGGNSYEVYLKNAVSASYELDTEGSAFVTLSNETAQSVTVTPIASGNAVLTVTATGYDLTQTVLTCQISVSKLFLSENLVEIYMNDDDHSTDVIIQGINPDAVYYGSGDIWDDSFRDDLSYSTQCSIDIGNNEVARAYFRDGEIHIIGYAKGITNVRGSIYGVSFSIKVKVYHYTLNKYTVNTYKGSAPKTLKVKGAGSEKVTWAAGNKNVADVSNHGIVTIKGIGATKINAKVNGRKLSCIVAVSSKTASRAVKNARVISMKKNIKYSQAQRMSKNYYDCSSLVYRCYASLGIRFGNTNPHWAPTAAEEGRWCAATKKLAASQPVDILSCKLVPGDTIYYSFNGNNGRYLNIDHTAIFAGYAYDESIGYYGTVIEASSSRNAVVERMFYTGNTIKLIGRPSKK